MTREIQPLLTIAIPTHNSGKFIGKTLKSISSQMSEEFRSLVQIVVIDNASQDSTLSIVAEHDFTCKLKVIKNPVNMGAHYSHDKCGLEADGKYIWFLGSQDALLPNALEKMIRVCEMERYTNILLNFSVANELDSSLDEINHYMIGNDLEIKDGYEFYRKLGGHALAMSANVILRENYLSVSENTLVSKNWTLYQRFFDSTFLKEKRVEYYFISDPVFILMQESDGWWTTPAVFLNFVALREIQRTSWKRNFKIYLFLTYRNGGRALTNSIALGRHAGYKPTFRMTFRLISLCFFDPRVFIAVLALYSPRKALNAIQNNLI
jgi:glycosyltransferase involved in cell wall biosynthesis